MDRTTDALRFPNHFPPKDRWKKFFIGVRWLGPDLSFFRQLKACQGTRHQDQMQIWGGGIRQEFATLFGRTLSKILGWKCSVFLPQDSLAVVFYGPQFRTIDVLALETAMQTLERAHGVVVPAEFWEDKEDCSFGEFIDSLVTLKVDRTSLERALLARD